MDLSITISAFIAGILTFLAPCTFPLVPGYLAFISGTSLQDINDPAKARTARWRIFKSGLFYVIGFSIVFIFMGSVFGLLGTTLAPYRRLLQKIGGVLVIIFGLFMLGILKIPFLSRETKLRLSFFEGGKPLNSFLLGVSFAFGWTPCIGPIVGSILTFAAASATVLQGMILLAIFSAGLGIPFLLIAIGIGSSARYIAKISKNLNVVSIIGGLLLIFLGYLLLTNQMAKLISWGYELFKFINYEKIQNYL